MNNYLLHPTWRRLRQLLLAGLVGLAACKSDTVSPVDNAFGVAKGSAMFWTHRSAPSIVTIDLTGQGSQTISIAKTSVPRCGTAGAANFVDVPAGTYAYTASAPGYVTVTGSITIGRDACTSELVDLVAGGGPGNFVFWADQQNRTPRPIIVQMGGASQILTGRFVGQPTCGTPTAATFANLNAGPYLYSAFTDAGESWQGSVTVVTGRCTAQSIGQAPIATTANALFYTTQNLGAVTVNVDTQSQILTGYFASGIPPCGTAGAATFGNLTTGPHRYTAGSTSGRVWNGTVNVVAGSCVKMLLQ